MGLGLRVETSTLDRPLTRCGRPWDVTPDAYDDDAEPHAAHARHEHSRPSG